MPNHESDDAYPTVVWTARSGEGGAACRFCSKSVTREPLVSPCRCTGSIGVTHRSCLHKWLRDNNTDRCKECKYVYNIKRTCKPLLMFFFDGGHRLDMIRIIVSLVTCLGDAMVLMFAWRYASSNFFNRGTFTFLLVLAVLLLQSTFWIVIAIIRAWTCYEPIRNWQRRTASLEVIVDLPRANMSPGESDGTTRVASSMFSAADPSNVAYKTPPDVICTPSESFHMSISHPDTGAFSMRSGRSSSGGHASSSTDVCRPCRSTTYRTTTQGHSTPPTPGPGLNLRRCASNAF